MLYRPLEDYIYFLVFTGVGAVFLVILFVLSRQLRPNKPDNAKLSTYECGMDPVGDSWIQFRIRYYIFALLFVLFDIETVFLFAIATVYRQLGLIALLEVFIFVGSLVVGLAYAWRKGVLEWT